MQTLVIGGRDAEWRAAALIRGLAAAGAGVGAARLGAEDEGGEGTEFVAAHGACWPNACFWLEFATGRPLTPGVPEEGFDFLVIVAPDGTPPPGQIAGRAVAALDAAALPVTRDAFGRPLLAAPVPGLPALPAPIVEAAGPVLRIGIVGHERHHRETYPAVLAALGEAAGRTGLAVQPMFLAPDRTVDDRLATLHGLILPGGSDLGDVPAQIAAALAARARGLPLFGLCLGMQSMTTAFLRRSGWSAATLEEVAGPGPERSFARLRDAAGRGLHRLGEVPLQARSGSRLAAFLPDGAMVRMNHRYALDAGAAALLPPEFLLHRGADGIAEAIEETAAPFCIGLQGHPEQGCDPALRGLWDGFLRVHPRSYPI